MALESKPLFHTEVIRQQMKSFTLPERVADWQPNLAPQDFPRFLCPPHFDSSTLSLHTSSSPLCRSLLRFNDSTFCLSAFPISTFYFVFEFLLSGFSISAPPR